MSDYGSQSGRPDRPRGGRGPSGPRYGGDGGGRSRGPDAGPGGRGRFEGRDGPRYGSRNGGSRGGRGRGGYSHAQCPADLREPFVEARDFLAGLIRAFGLPARLSFGGVEPARDGRQVMIDIRGLNASGERPRAYGRDEEPAEDDLGMLIGKHGATLDALTAITNAVMHRGESEGLFFAVDVEGYRSRRLATLRSIALRSGDRALREGVAIELAPMPPSERRIVHLTLASNPELATESTGTGINRRVVIVPRGFPPPRPDAEPPEEEY